MVGVCGLTFGALVAVSEAALGGTLPPVDLRTLREMAVELGLIPAEPTATSPLATLQIPPTLSPQGIIPPSETQPPPSDTATLTSTASPSATASSTPTATNTYTATPTSTSTPTVTETGTPTSTPSLTPAPSATLAPTNSPTRSPTRTATRTNTATLPASPTSATPTQPPTAGLTPTITGLPPTSPPSSTPTETSVAPTSTATPECEPSANSGFETTLLDLINSERQRQSLPAYALQGQLQTAARLHSVDMACNGFLSHTGSDGSTAGERVRRQGYAWSWVGENIYATGNTSPSAPQQAFDWWMTSALHRANLLSPNYVDIGIGYEYYAESPYGGYFTAVFARP